jgi:hypothetical protein
MTLLAAAKKLMQLQGRPNGPKVNSQGREPADSTMEAFRSPTGAKCLVGPAAARLRLNLTYQDLRPWLLAFAALRLRTLRGERLQVARH